MGWCSQWRSRRLPMLVAQVSSKDASVGEGSPRMVSVSSRLRRVAASMRISSPASSTASWEICAGFTLWVDLTYSSSAPAAPTATGRVSAPKPARSCVPKWRVSANWADAVSNCQGGSFLRGQLTCSKILRPLSSGSTSSAGFRRSSSLANSSTPVCMILNSPLAMDSQARPSVPLCMFTASTRLSRLSSSSAASVSVPGVTMRTTLRSTGPLARAGSPICSAMATDSPIFTSRAR